MSKIIIIPAPRVALARSGAYLALQAACEEIATAIEQRDREDGRARYTR